MKYVYRNSISDEVKMKRDIYQFMLEGFIKLENDIGRADYDDIFKYIMISGKGLFNPTIVEEALNEFTEKEK